MNRPHDNPQTAAHVEEVRMVLDPHTGKWVETAAKKRFIAPIPFGWIQQAAGLPGKTAQVALALCFLKGVKKSMTFKVTQEALSLSSCSRQAYYQALINLEQSGLASVQRPSGQRATVTLINYQ